MKYELTDETMKWYGFTLHRIRRCNGELGGWIESENNLSQEGDCWVADEAKVYGPAEICENAKLYDHAEAYGGCCISGHAHVHGYAKVYDVAMVSDYADIFGKAEIYDNARISDKAKIHGNVHIYGDFEVNGNSHIYDNEQIDIDEEINDTLRRYDMLEFDDFYDIAVYANDNWKAGMTQRELANNAYNLYADYLHSKETSTLNTSLINLLKNLWEDVYGSCTHELEDVDAANWLDAIVNSLAS